MQKGKAGLAVGEKMNDGEYVEDWWLDICERLDQERVARADRDRAESLAAIKAFYDKSDSAKQKREEREVLIYQFAVSHSLELWERLNIAQLGSLTLLSCQYVSGFFDCMVTESDGYGPGALFDSVLDQDRSILRGYLVFVLSITTEDRTPFMCYQSSCSITVAVLIPPSTTACKPITQSLSIVHIACSHEVTTEKHLHASVG